MGGCAMKASDPNSQRIEIQIKEDKKKMQNCLKILLLGAGESGKSTVAKQLKIINCGDFSRQELQEYRAFMHDNVKDSMKALLYAAETFGLSFQGSLADVAEKVKNLGPEPISPEIAVWVKTLWRDKVVQEVFDRAAEFTLNDNAKYTLENIDRIADASYIPTQQDALHCRVRTTGISETRFGAGKKDVVLIDVGGQRSERRKWMNCFDQVNCVLFCLALSEYNQKLAEDEETNRMHESFKIFDDICNKWFQETTVIAFLNKRDLFEGKITKIPLTVCFPEYKGANEFEPAVDYIQKKLQKRDKSQKARLFCHITCATDTTTFRMVYKAIEETLINSNLQDMGLL